MEGRSGDDDADEAWLDACAAGGMETDFGFRVSGLGSRVWGLVVCVVQVECRQTLGLGFGVWGLVVCVVQVE